MLQPGNTLQLTWRARLESHLGMFTAELVTARAARLIDSRSGVLALQTLAAHLRYLAERDPHPALYETGRVILDHLDEETSAARLMVRFEMALLDELGFGLDLSKCASTGRRDDLVYVSPKSGRAVSREAGAPWADRMLPLPAFLLQGGEAGTDDVLAGFDLTGHFLVRHLAEPRAVPLSPARDQFLRQFRAANARSG
ncbi:DNA repair protein RecO [Methylobrevis pamukkalensis]|uniref:DNA repair protein RecO n=1 Tax=Methylobrevis pamukkalensis TaxID=1439726 RepID=A0A1E3H294_9HYPH|nr:DNA repair protein RecO [Methylobrevis pamukkalensis]